MARSLPRRPSARRRPWSNPAVPQSTGGIRESDGHRYCPWPRMLTPEVVAGSGLAQDDVDALETIAEALFRGGVPDDKAAEVFDRAFGWAEDLATRKAAS
jgi:hypothetical protein